MPLICLSGPDGAGKSTIARKAAAILLRRGIKVRISWMRGTHTLASIIARFLRKFGAFRGEQNPYFKISIPSKFKAMWQLIEFISMLPVWIIKFAIPSYIGYSVIGERCLIDFIVWISITTRDPHFVDGYLGRISLALAMRSSQNVYVRADLETLKNRRRAEHSLLSKQLALYDLINGKILNLPVIDTGKCDIGESVEKLLDEIGSIR